MILWLVLALLSIISTYWGWYLGLSLLADPDTCWLLGTGRYIIEHGLPNRDVFSWTLAASDRPFIAYQWLTELIYWGGFQFGGALALVLSSSLSLYFAFVAVPYMVSKRLSAGTVPVLLISLLAFMAGSFHFFLRPELFSYTLLSVLYLSIFLYFEKLPLLQETAGWKRRGLLAFAGLVFFAFWANCHTGFLAGLLVLAALSGALLILFLGQKDDSVKLAALTLDSAMALIGAMLGTLVQPYGIFLYRHIFAFFSVSDKNVELAPLTLKELLFFGSFRPFALMLLVFAGSTLFVAFRNKTKMSEKMEKLPFPARWQALYLVLFLLTAISLALALACRRLVPFAALTETFYVLALTRASGFAPWQEALTKFTDGPRRLLYLVPVSALIFGAVTSVRAFGVKVPQDSASFTAPEAAITFVDRAKPVGRMLNDPQIGDVLIFRKGAMAKNFIDTRFDLYGEKLTLDFWKMANGMENWQELLDIYKIDWVFLIPDYRLVRLLSESGKWQETYRDGAAVILVRREPYAGRRSE